MAGLPFPLLSEIEKINERFRVIFEECSEKNMSEDEIWRHIWDNNLIPLQHILTVFSQVARTNPELFIIACIAKIRERNSQPLGNPPNVQRDPPAASPQVPQEAAANANAVENQNLQASQQQPAYPNDFWQQILTTLGQIQSNMQHLMNTLAQIQSKLLTDGHRSGPHPSSASGSLKKRKRVGENEERGEHEKGEKRQENERGGNEEAEKQITEKVEGNDEQGEKPQEKEEGNVEELQENDEVDN